uniref:Uncharacterized protein n=1 Tax=Cacopsylla melanoneura TaxID=428564 RepID=A0A8D8RA08_9HEMI
MSRIRLELFVAVSIWNGFVHSSVQASSDAFFFDFKPVSPCFFPVSLMFSGSTPPTLPFVSIEFIKFDFSFLFFLVGFGGLIRSVPFTRSSSAMFLVFSSTPFSTIFPIFPLPVV